MKGTAVEWLEEKIKANAFRIENDRLWKEAKEMEKQQIIDACIWFDDTDRSFSEIEKGAIDYYKEKYK